MILAFLDLLLGAALLVSAALALFGPGVRRGGLVFVAFGLLVTIAWVRLGAPDLALAEAAVGAGITGALLILGVRRMGGGASDRWSLGPVGRAAAWVGGGALFGSLVGVLAGLPGDLGPAAGQALARLGDSAVDNPVTAVLLVFRGYDTLLETAVVLGVVWGLRALTLAEAPAAPPDPVLDGMVRVLLPASVLVAAWLLWRGSDAPGGAFQGAAVLAAGLVVARVAGRWPPPLTDTTLRVAFAGGIGAFAALALWGLLAEGHALAWPVAGRKGAILAVETGLTGSLAVLLAALVPGSLLRRRP